MVANLLNRIWCDAKEVGFYVCCHRYSPLPGLEHDEGMVRKMRLVGRMVVGLVAFRADDLGSNPRLSVSQRLTS